MMVKEAGQRKQRCGGQEYRAWLIRHVGRDDGGHGQIRRTPGNGQERPALAAHQNPGGALTPEDAAHAARLTTVWARFRDHSERGAAKCNIRCGVLWG